MGKGGWKKERKGEAKNGRLEREIARPRKWKEEEEEEGEKKRHSRFRKSKMEAEDSNVSSSFARRSMYSSRYTCAS